jgi:hypothetical protein
VQFPSAEELLMAPGLFCHEAHCQHELPMSSCGVETPDERRARYLRLARAASETASKTPLPGAKEMYVRLAQAWVAMADENDHSPNISYEPPSDIPAPHGGLNVKLNERR